MIQSMTGFGKHTFEYEGKQVNIEIKSLNNKFSELNTRMPSIYREKEIEVRQLINNKMVRGKIDVYIGMDQSLATNHQINADIAKSYINDLKAIALETGTSTDGMMMAISRMPDVLSSPKQQLKDGEWAVLQQGILEAIEQATNFRKTEGEALEKALNDSAQVIAEQLSVVEANKDVRIEKLREKLNQRLEELQDVSVDEGRLEQELVYYTEKMDITEEIVRLGAHCKHFVEEMNSEVVSKGKKLGFIAQEMGREINTIGSKANDYGLQLEVVKMKDELEKIKEQVLNVL